MHTHTLQKMWGTGQFERFLNFLQLWALSSSSSGCLVRLRRSRVGVGAGIAAVASQTTPCLLPSSRLTRWRQCCCQSWVIVSPALSLILRWQRNSDSCSNHLTSLLTFVKKKSLCVIIEYIFWMWTREFFCWRKTLEPFKEQPCQDNEWHSLCGFERNSINKSLLICCCPSKNSESCR